MKTLYNYIEESYGWDNKLDIGEAIVTDNKTYLNSVAEHILNDDVTIPSTNPLTKTESNILFCIYILGRYRDWYVGENFLRTFANVLIRSYDEHKTLIDIYADKQAHLMDGIKVTSDNHFNDTPQNSGVYTDDSHATNTNHVYTVSDGATLMERIREITDNITDIYQKWADDFVDLFTPPYFEKED